MSILITSTFYSTVLHLDWNYDIYLPTDTKTQEYPLLLVLHGLYGNHTNFLDSNRIESKTLLDKLMLNQKEKMIVVFIDGFNSFYINSPKGMNMENAIIYDLMPYLRDHYFFSNSIGIGGISMGGYGAARLALRYPSLFSQVFLISPAIWRLESIPGFIHNSIHAFQDKRSNWSSTIYEKLYPTNYFSSNSQKINFFIRTSKYDKIVPVQDVISFSKSAKNNQNHVQLVIDQFGDHNWAYWKKAIKQAYSWSLQQLNKSS